MAAAHSRAQGCELFFRRDFHVSLYHPYACSCSNGQEACHCTDERLQVGLLYVE